MEKNFFTHMLSTRLGFSFLLLFAALGGCDDATDDAAKYDDERDACVARINAFRDTLDLPPLARWRDGERCADDEAKTDSKTKRAHSAFGSCGERAQNECPGWGSLEQVISGCLQMMWDEGPGEPYSEHGHFLNMSNTSYTSVACGFHVTDDGAVWAVQNFK